MINIDGLLGKNVFANTEKELLDFVTFLVKELKTELGGQNHVSSGKLMASIKKTQINRTAEKITYGIECLSYGAKLNSQQDRVKVTKPAILEWINNKMASGRAKPSFPDSLKGRKRIAYLIKRKIENNGVPSTINTRHSYNGRRLGWIDVPYNKHKKRIDTKVLPAVVKDVVIVLDKILSKMASEDKNIKYIP